MENSERSFLFESSSVFEGSTEHDRIRQSLIDVRADPPPADEVVDLIHQIFAFINSNEVSQDIMYDLYALVSECFMNYPNELESDFEKFFLSYSKKSFFHILISSGLLAIYKHVDNSNVNGQKDSVEFIEKALDEIRKQKDETLPIRKIFGWNVPKNFELLLILNLLRNSDLTTEIIEEFAKFIFSNDKGFHDRAHTDILLDISNKGLFSTFPKELLNDPFFIDKMEENTIIKFICFLSEESFKSLQKMLTNEVTRRKESDVTLCFLNKAFETKLELKQISKLLDSIEYCKITNDIWEKLKGYNFKVSSNFAMQMKDFYDIIFAFQIISEPQNVFDEKVIDDTLRSINDVLVFNKILSKNFIHPYLKTKEFWIKYINLVTDGKLAVINVKECCISNLADSFIEVITSIILDLYPLDNIKCEFIFSLLKTINMLIYEVYKEHENLHKLLDKVTYDNQPCSLFWKLVGDPHAFLDYKENINDLPIIILLGYAASCSLLNKLPTIDGKITILEQTDESLNEVFEVLLNGQSYDCFFNPTQLSEKAISFIATSILFTRASFSIRKKENFQIEGITIDNVFLFMSLCFQHVYFSKDQMFKTDNIFRMLKNENIENFRKLFSEKLNNKEPDEMLVYTISYFVDNLSQYIFMIIDKIPYVFDIINLLIPFFLREDSFFDPKVIIKYIIDILCFEYGDAQEVRVIFKDNTAQIIDYFRNNYNDLKDLIPEDKLIHLTEFNQDALKEKLSEMINTENIDILKIINFLSSKCIRIPEITIKNPDRLVNEIQKALLEKDLDGFTNLCHFFKNNSLQKLLLPFVNEPIPYTVKLSIFNSLSKSELTKDLLISLLLSSPYPERDKNVHDCILKFFDDGTIINYLVGILECANEKFSLTFERMTQAFSEEYNAFGDKFLKAIYHLYDKIPNMNILLLKPVPEPLEVISEKDKDFIQSLLNIAKEKPSYKVFAWLKCISSAFPFLFFDNTQEVIELCFNSFEGFEKGFSNQNNTDEGEFITSAAALIFISSLLLTPKILDQYIKWSFDKFNEFTNSQLYGFLGLLSFLFQVSSQQFVLISILLKDCTWLVMFQQILNKEIPEGRLKKIIISVSYLISSMLYRSLNNFNSEIIAYISELQTIENPFETTYSNNIFILPTIHRSLMFYNVPDNITKKTQRKLDFLQTKYLFKLNNKLPYFARPKNSKFIDDLRRSFPKLKQYNGYLPEGIDRETFNLLPVKHQSTILHHHLPNIPKQFNSQMIALTVHQPMWAAQWIKRPSSLLLLPEHYGILIPFLTQLNELSNNEDQSISTDEFLFTYFFQGGIFNDLINIAKNETQETIIPALFTLINEISKNGLGLLTILDIIKDNLINGDKNVIYNLLQTLIIISANNNFTENFCGVYDETLLDVICSAENRRHSIILLLASDLFLNLKIELPSRITHLITFMFLSGDSSILTKALDLCSKLNEEKRETVMPYVRSSFDNALKNFQPIRSNEIIQFLKHFPVIASERQVQLLKLLDDLLQSLQKQEYDIIGELFDVLAPRRNLSQSIRIYDSYSIDTDGKNINSRMKSIPVSISSQAPYFWDVFAKNQEKINQIIDNDPRKLQTMFKFLIDYPELTSFKTRRFVFQESLHRKLIPSLINIVVKRETILTDSFRRLGTLPPNELLKNIHVTFYGENGVDAGGLKRNWFTYLIKEILNPNYALFLPSANGRSYQPNPSSYVNLEHIAYFKFAGKILARALIDGVNVDAHLTTSFCKHILQAPVSLRDLEDVDETLHRSLNWILNNDISELGMQFTTDIDEYGVHKTIDLKPNGSNIDITNENKEEFVNLMVEHRLKKQISSQINAFCEGFYSLIPLEEIRRFSPNELDLIICGVPEIKVDDFQKYCEYVQPYHSTHPVIKYFFNVISRWNNENLAKLLLFMTGSSQVPLDGFKFFKDVGQPITIAPGGGRERLPAAHTCFNTIDLPEYENEDELNEKLLFAIQECNSFGFI